MLSQGTRTASPYRRLKLVMDYWSALWFWPIRESERLPSRQDFLNEVSLVLTGSVYHPEVGTQVRSLFGDDYADAEHAADIAQRITDEVGMLDLEKLFEQFPRLRFVDELARRRRFHHWELTFADLFYGAGRDGKARGGFDLVLGNPPWIKVEWEERGVLGERNPAFALRKLPASELSKQRAAAFERHRGATGCVDCGGRGGGGDAGVSERWAELPAPQGATDEPLQVLSPAGLDDCRKWKGHVGLPSSRRRCTTIQKVQSHSGQGAISAAPQDAFPVRRTSKMPLRGCAPTGQDLQRERVRASRGTRLRVYGIWRTSSLPATVDACIQPFDGSGVPVWRDQGRPQSDGASSRPHGTV